MTQMEPGLYNMDCMEAMKQFPDKFFDLAIVDPPYGISVTSRHKGGALVGGGKTLRREKDKIRMRGEYKKALCALKFYHAFDDSAPPEKGYFDELRRVAKKQIIWGGNFFLDYLGAASCMIVWDKKKRGLDQADCEIAWTDMPGQSRIFEFTWNGMLQGDMKNKEERIHPTQKPVALYGWILSRFAKPGYKILDTHAGSASSLVACHRAGLDAWGFEIDAEYYRMAKERLDKEKAQCTMFEMLQQEVIS